MYLGSTIWRRLNKYSNKLSGTLSLKQLREEIELIVKPFGAKVELIPRPYAQNKLFAIGGEYDPCLTKQPITIQIYIRESLQQVYLSKKRKQEFIFQLSQTLQHELIHKHQFQRRGTKTFYTNYFYFTTGSAKRGYTTMEYLATVEEIDAYAHDLAMEIKYYYPDKDPKQVLKKLNDYSKLYTWLMYRRAFKKARWLYVRNELLKKTYQWLPYINEDSLKINKLAKTKKLDICNK